MGSLKEVKNRINSVKSTRQNNIGDEDGGIRQVAQGTDTD